MFNNFELEMWGCVCFWIVSLLVKFSILKYILLLKYNYFIAKLISTFSAVIINVSLPFFCCFLN